MFDEFDEIDEEEPLNAKSFTKFVLKFKKLTRIIKRFFIMIYIGACMAYLDNLDLLKVLGPPDLEGRGVEGVAGDEVIRVTCQAVQLAQLLCPGEKSRHNTTGKGETT